MTTASSGLGISGFLKHTNDSGGGGQWLRQWRKKGVGEVTIWLHTRAPIVPCFSHSFMLEDEYEDKETGRTMPTLRYPRFVSPDAEVVHRNQYFRNDDQTLQVPPDMDPFLLLREWLRFGAEHIGLEDPIFKWNDEKNRQLIVWERGELSGLVKRGKKNFNHSVDTKLEYVYVVVDNDDVDGGPVLAREGKLVSQKLVEVIKQQQKTWGEVEGDPMQHPYAFHLLAEEASSPMNAYKAFKNERAEFSDAVWAQISAEEFPDPLPFGQPAEGDMEKIRDAFERAAQVELPLDQIFSDDPEVRRELTRNAGGKRQAPRASKASQTKAPTAAQRPPPPQAGAKPAAAATAAPATTPAAATGSPQMRTRKKVEKPPEPAAEMIGCDDCGQLMLATATKCPGCGAEYEVEESAAAVVAQAASAAAPKPSGQNGASRAAPASVSTTAATRPKPNVAPKPASSKAGAAKEPQQESQAAPGGYPNCWSCGVDLGGKGVCPSCGIEQGDEIPF